MNIHPPPPAINALVSPLRVTGPLAHDVVLNHTFELLMNTTMLF